MPLAVATVESIRTHFPALDRHEGGHPVAYFDGPGGTQVPRQVGDAMLDYLHHHNANTHWSYPSSAETDAALSGARQAFADFLNASSDEIAFGANMTTLTLHLSRAVGRRLQSGDEIVVTELDHHANVDPWREMARDRNVEVRTVRMDPESGQLDLKDLAGKLTSKTRLLAIGAASNALGTISDVRSAATIAHDAGALVFVDAVHYAPHALVDVESIGCDFLACSAYKFYGPHVGILFAKAELLGDLDFPRLLPAGQAAPERAETGTLNHEGIVGAAAAVDFLASLSGRDGTRRDRLAEAYEALHGRGTALVRQLWDGLEAIEAVKLYGPPPGIPRTPTVAFTIRGIRPEDVATRLADRGVFVSHGDFYAMTVVERLGLADSGLVRAGCGIYTTAGEFSRLIAGIQDIAGA
ncbi:MAG: cysteine desulfurase-like protein [Gemmatimonadaceae bacterium]